VSATIAAVAAQRGWARTRDQAASELFTAHYGRLAGWLRRLVDDDETAHELAGEAFARVLGAWRRVNDPVGYLYVVGANLVRDHWRKAARQRAAVGTLSVADVGSGASPSASDVELRMVVRQLPEPQRVAVLLHYYADMAIGDIAHLTGRPEGTIKSDLSRARVALRTALSQQPGEVR
jgi:RNA polymerase sigma-70 factor (ECF subfamily)